VVVPFNIACGTCVHCNLGLTHSCLTANPHGPSAVYGYASMGPYRGGQADFLRVPFADFNLLKLPGEPGDRLEDDFVLLSDIFPTGYHAAELAGVGPGSTVAVFGAGSAGLLAAYSAMLRGAAEVYVVDFLPHRLRKAEQIGAIAIDLRQGDPVEQILELRRRNPLVTDAMRPGEEKLMGVGCGIDAVGYQARDDAEPSREKPTQVLEDLVRLVNPGGRIGVVGVYMPEDPGGIDERARHGRFEIPWGRIFEKAITVAQGQTPVKRYNTLLRELIIAGRAKPSFIDSQRLPLNDAADAYARFDRREEGYTKVILKPHLAEVGA
jgi:glutathione-independent formaldehyde dehydrogenase